MSERKQNGPASEQEKKVETKTADSPKANGAAKKRRSIESSTLRTITALLLVIVVCIGLAFHTGTGTASSFGIGTIATLCPLGGVEAAIASRTVVPPMLIGLLIVIVLTVIFGRAFCAWGCPVPLLRRIFGGKKAAEGTGADSRKKQAEAFSAETDGEIEKNAAHEKKHLKTSKIDVPNPKRGGIHDSRYWVLGGAIVTTAAFGFPVFCLVCPVGLTFATLILIWRLFQFSEVTAGLVVFPLILVFELVVLRKWCHRFCPLGALLSLISRLNRTFRPKPDGETCLHLTRGEACHRCADACPEGIDLHRKELSAPMNECTKCRRCADACPVHAITFPIISKVDEKEAAGK